jgi:Protein of unknown function (DUF3667)
MTAEPSAMDARARCLNCGATLVGRFCAACGQRALPPHPTVRELAGDTWRELSGYDGRIAATFRGLLKPGLLTRRYVEGQRARYLSPVRLYLIVSVVYFLVAAAAPSLDERGRQTAGPGLRFGVTGTESGNLTPEERERLLKDLESTNWMLRPLLKSMATNPEEYRRQVFTIMPRVFFGMLPVFAGIVFLFYRSETFPTALVFAVHLHAFAFVTATVSEAAKFTGSRVLAATVGGIATIVFVVYVFRAVRAVFGGRMLKTTAKIAAIGLLYLLASVPAFIIILAWAALS